MGALPNLIVPGFMKCGTTSLHRYLDAHPEIRMSAIKEPNYFFEYGNRGQGLDWYRGLFSADAPVRGEASVNYTSLPATEGVAERIAATVPEAKLIFMLRDPIDRAISHYRHEQALGRERRPLPEALGDGGNRYVSQSRYATQMAPFLAAFERSRVLVLTAERLRARRAETVKRAFEFLGVDPEAPIDPQALAREWEVGVRKGRRFQLAYRLAERSRMKSALSRLPAELRWRIEGLALGGRGQGDGPAPGLDHGFRAELTELLTPEVEPLADLIGEAREIWSV